MYPSDDSPQATALAQCRHAIPASVSERRFPASHSTCGAASRAANSVSERRFPASHSATAHPARDGSVYPSDDSPQATASHGCTKNCRVYPSDDSPQATARSLQRRDTRVYPSDDSPQATARLDICAELRSVSERRFPASHSGWQVPLVYPSDDSLQATARPRLEPKCIRATIPCKPQHGNGPHAHWQCIRATIPCKPQLRTRCAIGGLQCIRATIPRKPQRDEH